ncbi:integrase [Synergistales bacterium]|nr:integrase [Synergistales bacterium]
MLTDTAIKKFQPKKSRYMVADHDGLYISIQTNGKKFWRFRYTEHGKRSYLSLGEYPLVSLAVARVERDKLRLTQSEGKSVKVKPAGESLEAVAREWHKKNCEPKSEKYSKKIMAIFENHIFKHIGFRPIDELTAPEILAPLRRIESQGKNETAQTAREVLGAVYRYAVASGYAIANPVDALRGALAPVIVTHNASLTDPVKIQGLIRAMDALTCSAVVRSAIWFSAYCFLRPGEVRNLEWSEVFFDKAEIRIPETKMKMRRLHIVPLAPQVSKLLKDLQSITGQERYVFPAVGRKGRPMSENTVSMCLRSMGYTSDQMTAHGFRSMASTLLNEQGWSVDAIERQLAHVEGNSVRAAYNYAEYLPERRKMMVAWADWLDSLK